MQPRRWQPKGVDIWALGCVMFELSALKPAFSAFNMEGLVKKIATGPTPQVERRVGRKFRGN